MTAFEGGRHFECPQLRRCKYRLGFRSALVRLGHFVEIGEDGLALGGPGIGMAQRMRVETGLDSIVLTLDI